MAADDTDETEIDGEDEPCGHEAEALAEAPEPRDVAIMREMLYHSYNPPQRRDPVSGSAQLEAVRTHAEVCRAVRRCVRAVARRIKSDE